MTSRRGQRELGLFVQSFLVVRATDETTSRAGSKRFVDDGLDGPRTAAAFHAAAEAAMDLSGMPQHIIRGADRMANIVVAENIAGADNHRDAQIRL